MHRSFRPAALLPLVGLLFGAALAVVPAQAATKKKATTATATSAPARITVLYDAFGRDPALKKDWGYAALIEVGGKRILFDTGNDPAVFEANVKAKGVDLSTLDLVVMSHRHSDHMAGLGVVLAANPTVKVIAPAEGFGIYGSSLPSSFYRKDASLPADMRYYDGAPPETLQFGAAWPRARFTPLKETTEIAPGVWAISTVSDAVGTKELRELSLAIRTDEGIVLVVGCSHPGIASIVAEAKKIDTRIQLVAGGFHFVTADDAAIASLVTALHDTLGVANVAPGHCTGEPTFAALQKAFGKHYLYAGVGTQLPFTGKALKAVAAPGNGAGLAADELDAYRVMASVRHEREETHLAER